jgi:hypothetical protein
MESDSIFLLGSSQVIRKFAQKLPYLGLSTEQVVRSLSLERWRILTGSQINLVTSSI